MVERVSTGIPGLDEAIEGGLPDGSVTLVSGGTGSGKTTFCAQFLWYGYQNGDTCLFITTEELPEEVREDAEEFGWDFDNTDAPGEFSTFYIDPATKTDHTAENIEDAIEQVDPDRVVIDSLSVIEAYWEDEKAVRGNVHNIIRNLRDRDVTTVLTAESMNHDGRLSRYGIAEYVVDGVIALNGLQLGESTFRSLQVIKMRKTDIAEDIFGLDLTDDGIIVEEEEAL